MSEFDNTIDHTPRLALPVLFAGQAQKEFVVNEGLARLDVALWPVVGGVVDIPPSAPEEGEAWLVGPAATEAWAGRTDTIATRALGDWVFVVPLQGMRVWDREAGAALTYDNGWHLAPAPPPIEGGTVIDTQARAQLVALVAALRKVGILAAPAS